MHRADTPCRECHKPEWKCDCGIPEPTEKPARRRHWPWVGFLVGFIILEAGGFALLFWPDPVAKEPPQYPSDGSCVDLDGDGYCMGFYVDAGVTFFETTPEKMIFDIPVVFGEDVVFEQEVTFKKGFSQPAQD